MGAVVREAIRSDVGRSGGGFWEASVRDIREQLAQHLTAHGVPLELGIRATDLDELLRGMDFAMLLGMIGPKPAGMLLAKYCGDAQEERKCRAWWLMECIETGAAKGWRRPKARMIEGFAYATIEEHMGHGTRCGTCNGTKERMVGHLPVICPSCMGYGFIPYSPDRMMESIMCSTVEWDKVWRDRVGWARRRLHRWEADAVQALVERHG
jgi:hypothetical protein